MIIVLVILLYGFLFVIDGTPILKEYKSKKAVTYITIFSSAFLLNILTVLKVKIPNPAKGIEKIITLIIGK